MNANRKVENSIDRKRCVRRQRCGRRGKRVLRAALCLFLCVTTLTSCTNILSDGEIVVETAPPIITPKVTVIDTYGQGSPDRFNISGTDAFFLLPGIENNPDNLEDFNCLDYTDGGYFIYYYCAPSYISADKVRAYKGMSGTAPEGKYGEGGQYTITEETSAAGTGNADANDDEDVPATVLIGGETVTLSGESPCDAMIVMAYRPDKRMYYVMDAQAYEKDTANSQTGGEANTGMDFYASSAWGFYTLSHCFGCKIAGQHRYFIFDQAGQTRIYDDSFKTLLDYSVGGRITSKVNEVAAQLSLKGVSGTAGSGTGSLDIDTSGAMHTETKTDASSLEDDDSDEAKESRAEVKKELAEAMGKDASAYDEGDQVQLNCLIKSAVMDGENIMYFSCLLYQGDSPWVSETLLDRVIQIYAFDLSGDMIHFVSELDDWGEFVSEYRFNAHKYENDAEGLKSYIDRQTEPRYFTSFQSDLPTFDAFLGGSGSLMGSASWYLNIYFMMEGVTETGMLRVARAESLLEHYGKKMKTDSAGYHYLENVIAAAGLSRSEADDIRKLVELWEDVYTSDDDNTPTGIAGTVTDAIIATFESEDTVRDYLGKASASISDSWKKRFSSLLATTSEDVAGEKELVNSIWISTTDKVRNILRHALVSGFDLACQEGSFFTNEGAIDNIEDYLWELRSSGLILRPGDWEIVGSGSASDFSIRGVTGETIYGNNIPTEPGKQSPQAWMLIHGTSTDYTEGFSLPHTTAIEMPGVSAAWYEPYTYNEEVTVPLYETNTAAANEILRPVEAALDMTKAEMLEQMSEQVKGDETESAPVNNIYDPNFDPLASKSYKYETEWDYVEFNVFNSRSQLAKQIEAAGGIGAYYDIVWNALHDRVAVPGTSDPSYSIPAGTFITSYVMRFPEGTVVDFADMDNTAGSTTASVTAGALLFSDSASTDNSTLSFTSSIRWQRESGVVLKDDGIAGAAIDSGALEFGTGDERKLMPLLITDQGVKFYPVYDKSGASSGSAVYAANTELLTSTGFTPYTESGMQAAVAKKIGSGEEETYEDAAGGSGATEEKIAQSLNSSRVGTIQSVSSFTVLNDSEVLISAYDTGLTLLRLPNGSGKINRMQIQDGSFYQSFAYGIANNYVVLGYNTEDFQYGSMDLARAKVYNLNLGERKNEIYLNAFTKHLDQLAADYVRRLNRTRTEFTTDADGSITGQKVSLVSFSDDHGEEAESERKLFVGDLSSAVGELKQMEAAIGMAHQSAAEEYLKELRTQIAAQQAALAEVLSLTGATKLGSTLNTDTYWVGFKERLQATTELGDLKDLLAEAATAEDVVKTMSAEQKADYQEKRKVLNYRTEEKEKNDAIGKKDSVDAADFEVLLDKRKTAADFTEDYDTANRGKDEPVNPLYEYLNTDAFTAQANTRDETSRATVREEVLNDIKETYFTAHPLEPLPVYAPDGTSEMRVTQERKDEVWDNYLEGLLARVNPDNLTATRPETTEEEEKAMRGTGSTAAKMMAQLVEFLCEGVDNVTQETKTTMVEDLLNGIELVSGALMAEEAVLIERMTLPKFSAYRTAYDAFNQTDYDGTGGAGGSGASGSGNATDGSGGSGSGSVGAAPDLTLSSGASLRRAAYEEQEFYKRVLLPVKESKLVQAYLETNGYTWEQYMASLPTLVRAEVEAGGGDWEAEAKAVYETFEPFAPIKESDKVKAADGTEERPTLSGE